MKTVKIFLALTALALTACDDALTEPVNFEVGIAKADNVQIASDGTITAPVGTKLTFNFSGEPDFISFSYDLFNATSSKLSFNSLLSWNDDSDSSLQLFVSESFAGLVRDDAKTDSIAINTHDWKNLSSECVFPVLKNESKASAVQLDEYKGKTITLAFRYKTLSNSGFQPMWTISDLQIDNTVIKTGESAIKIAASAMGFAPFDMFKVSAGEAYNTATIGSGIWDTSNPASLRIRQTSAGRELNEDWLISRPISLPNGKLETGESVAVKNTTDNVTSYSHVFDEDGEYTVRFKAVNYNYKAHSEVERSFRIVIE
ncbi:MAG: DUF5017 domain-containing protein [Prevotella sp.]|jgi:hypothetical protein|nr:DUF5017 domain-containing protein [Prevotella sp.]